jgi:Tfp pilus assembly protein PilP
MKHLLSVPIVLVLFVLPGAAPAEAQIAVGTRVGESSVASAGSYSSLGRRDPFVSLIAPRRSPADRTAPTGQGLASVYISDANVTGIVKAGDTMMALIQGADRRSFVAKVGDRLADGTVRRIDSQGVVFVETGLPGSGIRPQEVRRLLRSAAEVNR